MFVGFLDQERKHMLILQSSFYRLTLKSEVFSLTELHLPGCGCPTQWFLFLLEYDTQSGGRLKIWSV